MAVKRLKVKYIKSYDFKSSLATGIYGGIATNGLISANFFVDRVILPDSQLIEVDEATSKMVGEPVDSKDADIAREVVSGILIDVNTAKVIIDWLTTKVKDYDANFNKK